MANKKLRGIVWPNMPDDVYILDAEKVEYDNTENYPSGSVGKALNEKANVDGYYSNLTSGSAEQLLSTVRENDKTPYLFRTSGGSVDIGDREYINGIVGGTAAWNQLVQNGNFESTTGWSATDANYSVSNNVATFTATAKNGVISSNTVGRVAGHRYLMLVDAKGTSAVAMAFIYSWGQESSKNFNITTDWQTFCQIITAVNSAQGYAISVRDTRDSGWDAIYIRNAMLIDLTQMFGSTIADYIYSLETANAGAGVAWFKKLFPKPYYAYNAGELMSVSGVSAHNMTGFNQWDEEWEVGAIVSGEPTSSTNQIRSKNFCPCIGDTTYYLRSSKTDGGSNNKYYVAVVWYDANKQYISSVYFNNGTNVSPSNARYFKITTNSSAVIYGATYLNDICLNISWDGSRNGEYEPYVLHSYPLDSDLTLRGIPKLDANNNLYYDGDTYEPDGTVTRKYGIVDMGTLTYGLVNAGTDNERFLCNSINSTLKLASSNSVAANVICTKYVTRSLYDALANDKSIGVYADGGFIIKDLSFNSADALKTALSGVYLVYELATPTTEQADPYTNPQIVNDFGTEEFVIDSEIAVPIPVGHDTDYPIDMVAKLEMAPNSPDGNGDYIVRQTNGMNSYVPLVIEDTLPTIPSTAGSYKLTVTVTEGSDPVLSWEAE